jgi:hypothetical protein
MFYHSGPSLSLKKAEKNFYNCNYLQLLKFLTQKIESK